MHSSKLVTFLSVAAILSVVFAGAAALAEDCDAWAQATLGTQEQGENTVSLEFGVEVNVEQDCARVTYDLVIEELMPNGQTKQIRVPRQVKLADGSFEEVVLHKMPASHTLNSYEARIVECSTCEVMP